MVRVLCRSPRDSKEPVYDKLLEVGKIYLWERIEGDRWNFKFNLHLNYTLKDYIIVSVNFHDDENFDWESLLVFSGLPDGSCFIDDTWREKALEFLGGKWYD